MPDQFQFDVFLSHNSQDKPRVRKLAERLKQAGLRVWLDEWVIQPGDDIYLAVERGLEAARVQVQVLCLSQAALGSEWVDLERSTVLFRNPSNSQRRFIPLLLADCKLPDTLRRYKYVDFREEAEVEFAKLLTACRPEAGERATGATQRADGRLAPVGEPHLPLQRPAQPHPTMHFIEAPRRKRQKIIRTSQLHRRARTRSIGRDISAGEV